MLRVRNTFLELYEVSASTTRRRSSSAPGRVSSAEHTAMRSKTIPAHKVTTPQSKKPSSRTTAADSFSPGQHVFFVSCWRKRSTPAVIVSATSRPQYYACEFATGVFEIHIDYISIHKPFAKAKSTALMAKVVTDSWQWDSSSDWSQPPVDLHLDTLVPATAGVKKCKLTRVDCMGGFGGLPGTSRHTHPHFKAYSGSLSIPFGFDAIDNHYDGGKCFFHALGYALRKNGDHVRHELLDRLLLASLVKGAPQSFIRNLFQRFHDIQTWTNTAELLYIVPLLADILPHGIVVRREDINTWQHYTVDGRVELSTAEVRLLQVHLPRLVVLWFTSKHWLTLRAKWRAKATTVSAGDTTDTASLSSASSAHCVNELFEDTVSCSSDAHITTDNIDDDSISEDSVSMTTVTLSSDDSHVDLQHEELYILNKEMSESDNIGNEFYEPDPVGADSDIGDELPRSSCLEPISQPSELGVVVDDNDEDVDVLGDNEWSGWPCNWTTAEQQAFQSSSISVNNDDNNESDWDGWPSAWTAAAKQAFRADQARDKRKSVHIMRDLVPETASWSQSSSSWDWHGSRTHNWRSESWWNRTDTWRSASTVRHQQHPSSNVDLFPASMSWNNYVPSTTHSPNDTSTVAEDVMLTDDQVSSSDLWNMMEQLSASTQMQLWSMIHPKRVLSKETQSAKPYEAWRQWIVKVNSALLALHSPTTLIRSALEDDNMPCDVDTFIKNLRAYQMQGSYFCRSADLHFLCSTDNVDSGLPPQGLQFGNSCAVFSDSWTVFYGKNSKQTYQQMLPDMLQCGVSCSPDSYIQPGCTLLDMLMKLATFIDKHAEPYNDPTTGQEVLMLPKHIHVVIYWAGNEFVEDHDHLLRTKAKKLPECVLEDLTYLEMLAKCAPNMIVVAGALASDWNAHSGWDVLWDVIRSELQERSVCVWHGHGLARDTKPYRQKWWNHETEHLITDDFHTNGSWEAKEMHCEYLLKVLEVSSLTLEPIACISSASNVRCDTSVVDADGGGLHLLCNPVIAVHLHAAVLLYLDSAVSDLSGTCSRVHSAVQEAVVLHSIRSTSSLKARVVTALGHRGICSKFIEYLQGIELHPLQCTSLQVHGLIADASLAQFILAPPAPHIFPANLAGILIEISDDEGGEQSCAHHIHYSFGWVRNYTIETLSSDSSGGSGGLNLLTNPTIGLIVHEAILQYLDSAVSNFMASCSGVHDAMQQAVVMHSITSKPNRHARLTAVIGNSSICSNLIGFLDSSALQRLQCTSLPVHGLTADSLIAMMIQTPVVAPIAAPHPLAPIIDISDDDGGSSLVSLIAMPDICLNIAESLQRNELGLFQNSSSQVLVLTADAMNLNLLASQAAQYIVHPDALTTIIESSDDDGGSQLTSLSRYSSRLDFDSDRFLDLSTVIVHHICHYSMSMSTWLALANVNPWFSQIIYDVATSSENLPSLSRCACNRLCRNRISLAFQTFPCDHHTLSIRNLRISRVAEPAECLSRHMIHEFDSLVWVARPHLLPVVTLQCILSRVSPFMRLGIGFSDSSDPLEIAKCISYGCSDFCTWHVEISTFDHDEPCSWCYCETPILGDSSLSLEDFMPNGAGAMPQWTIMINHEQCCIFRNDVRVGPQYRFAPQISIPSDISHTFFVCVFDPSSSTAALANDTHVTMLQTMMTQPSHLILRQLCAIDAAGGSSRWADLSSSSDSDVDNLLPIRDSIHVGADEPDSEANVDVHSDHETTSTISEPNNIVKKRGTWFNVLLTLLFIKFGDRVLYISNIVDHFCSRLAHNCGYLTLGNFLFSTSTISPVQCELTATILRPFIQNGFRITMLRFSPVSVYFVAGILPRFVTMRQIRHGVCSIVIDAEDNMNLCPTFSSQQAAYVVERHINRFGFYRPSPDADVPDDNGGSSSSAPDQSQSTMWRSLSTRAKKMARNLQFENGRWTGHLLNDFCGEEHKALLEGYSLELKRNIGAVGVHHYHTNMASSSTAASSTDPMTSMGWLVQGRLSAVQNTMDYANPQDIAPHLKKRIVEPRYKSLSSKLSSAHCRWIVVLDLPLPSLLCRQVFRDNRTKYTATDDDVLRQQPDLMKLSSRTYISDRWLTWLLRRVGCNVLANTLRQMLCMSYIDSIDDLATTMSSDNAAAVTCFVVGSLPSHHLLRSLTLSAAQCFFTDRFIAHQRSVIELDGSGIRTDFEFKMATRIHNRKRKSPGSDHFAASCCIRGVHGLFLDGLVLSQTGENQRAYENIFNHIFKIRREMCNSFPRKGMPHWVCFDNGPVYGRAAYKSADTVWPEAALLVLPGTGFESTYNDDLTICSDPVHRIFRLQQAAASTHPDYRCFIRDVRFVIRRLSAQPCVTAAHENNWAPLKLSAHVKACFVDLISHRGQTVKSRQIINALSDADISAIRLLLNAKDALQQKMWQQLFNAALPSAILCHFAQLFKVGVHPINDCYPYKDLPEYVKSICEIEKFYKKQRTVRIRRTTKTDATIKRRSTGITCTKSVIKEMTNMRQDPSLTAIWNWHRVCQRYHAAGIHLKTGTAEVEGAFWALRNAIRMVGQSNNWNEETFVMMSRLAAMGLNVWSLSNNSASGLDRHSLSQIRGMLDSLIADSMKETSLDARLVKFRNWMREHPPDAAGGASASQASSSQDLPDLFSAEDGLTGARYLPNISDPINSSGEWDAEVCARYRQAMRDKMLHAAESEQVDPGSDMTNLLDHSRIVNQFIDVAAVTAKAKTAVEIQRFLEPAFDAFFSADVVKQGLIEAAARHAQYPLNQMTLRPLADIFIFIGRIYGVHPTYAAAPFFDNCLFLTKNTFRLQDRGMVKRVAKSTVLLAFSGMGKSPLLKMYYDLLRDRAVTQALGSSGNPDIKAMEKLPMVKTQGNINMSKLYREAETINEPCGFRIIVEELSQAVNEIGGAKPNASRLDPQDFIAMVDPTFQSGKDNCQNSQSISNLRVIITAGCQPNKLPFFLPHTLEGESFRVEVLTSPLEDSTGNDHRPNKTVKRDASLGLLAQLHATIAGHILPNMQTVVVDERTSGVLCLVELVAKKSAQRYLAEKKTNENDPYVHYVNGKLDGVFLTALAECWLLREAYMKFIFPEYVIRYRTHPIDGRMALNRTLFLCSERRGIVTHTLNTLYMNKSLWTKYHGASVLPPGMEASKKRSREEDVESEEHDQENVTVMMILGRMYAARMDNILAPSQALSVVQNYWGKENYRTVSALIPLYCKMSESYHIIFRLGYGSNVRDAHWLDIEPGSAIVSQNMRSALGKGSKGGRGRNSRGGSGGRPSTPFLEFYPSGSASVSIFKTAVASSEAAAAAASEVAAPLADGTAGDSVDDSAEISPLLPPAIAAQQPSTPTLLS